MSRLPEISEGLLETHLGFPFWKCLDRSSRQVIRSLMPEGWEPPKEAVKKIGVVSVPESLEEIGQIMRSNKDIAR